MSRDHGLARVYGICEDLDGELGPLAAILPEGQLRSLVCDVLGRASALQWYAVSRLGGIPDGDGDVRPAGDEEDGEVDWDAVMATANFGTRASANGAPRP